MLRTIPPIMIAILLALTVSSAAEARPDSPVACRFVAGFLAFRQALGEEIVGDCESDQTYDRSGHAQQVTSEGTLYWNHQTNLVSFHNGFELWMDGPGGISSTVTVAGLSDKYAQRSAVRAPAAVVFQQAGLRAEDLDTSELGGEWWYTDVTIDPLRIANLACMLNRTDPAFGTYYTWLVDEENQRAVMHSLAALPDDMAGQMRALFEQEVAACDGRTQETPGGDFFIRMSLEPFIDLGDESTVFSFVVEDRATSKRRGTTTAYVRYGGLVSGVAILAPADLPPDEGRALLEQAARAAHNRIQTAAWYLRD